jgi:DmsE family decaheme c-type cytochrome
MQYAQPSHHPVPENRMVCTDCHDPHGSTTEFDLRGPTVRDTCSRCHAEYSGPFVFEHGDVTENCANCHRPHGSLQAKLLTTAQPFLCMQCHPTGAHAGLESSGSKKILFGRCTDCHSSIHGSDTPSARGRGTFIDR